MMKTQTPAQEQSTRQRRSRWTIPLVVLAGLVLIGGAGLYWFFSGEAPAEVDLAATASAVAESDTDAGVSASQTATGIEGVWSVDTSIGEFTVTDDTTATFVGFRVDEVLSSIGDVTAVGRSPEVSGTIEISGTTLSSAEIVVDMTAIVSDESRRDDRIQQALNTGTNPEATFVLVEALELGDGAAEGEIISAVAEGELTVNGVTSHVHVDIEAQLIDDMVLITGSTEVVFDDYGVTAPTAPSVLSVEDHGIIEFQLWMSR